MSLAISRLSCFSPIHVRQHICSRSCPSLKVLAIRSHGARITSISCSDSNITLSYTEDSVTTHDDGLKKTYSDANEHFSGNVTSEPTEDVVTEEIRAAKIHDFCFGIPYGGLVLSGGLVGSIFSRNLASLGSGLLFGGALLALSTFSLKIWRQGKSSLPFILGQAVLTAALLWKNLQAYSMTKKVFPTAFYAVVSATMLCFYTYVVISGGNPPPKKLKSSAAATS